MAIIICNYCLSNTTNRTTKKEEFFSVLFFFRKNSRNLCLYIERSKVNPDDFSFSNYSEPELNNCLILCVLPLFFV